MSSSTGGDDIITGGASSLLAYGDAYGMSSSTGGNDTITGGAGPAGFIENFLVGDAFQTSEGHSTGGNDTLTGGICGGNTLVGDIAYVYAGASVQGGNDRLVSAANTPDDMWGDFQNIVGGTVAGGHDTFVFKSNNGNDIVHDFHQGEDIIELGNGLLKTSANGAAQMSLKAASNLLHFSIETVDANHDGSTDSVIHFDANNSVTVLGVAHLTAQDFFFV